MINFLIGLFTGTFLGAIIMGIVAGGTLQEEKEESYMRGREDMRKELATNTYVLGDTARWEGDVHETT